jgi:hypothetical protein
MNTSSHHVVISAPAQPGFAPRPRREHNGLGWWQRLRAAVAS